MNLVAIVNSKGGVGKTTITAALSVRAAQEFDRVAIVDFDNAQSSLIQWFQSRVHTDKPALFRDEDYPADAVEALSQTGWDWVFMDGPPSGLTTIEEMIDVADLVLIPLKPSILDFRASADVVEMARKKKKPYLVLFSDITPTDRLRVAEARKFLASEKLTVADTQLSHRASHISAMNVGKTAAEVNGGRDKEAIAEIEALWTEIKKAMRAAQRKQKAHA